jgi:iron complex outermembrane receptor protein
MKHHFSLRYGIALCALCVPGMALAQETSPANDVTEDGASGGVADIVVTAQRRNERLQDVPVAVSAISGDRLAAIGIQSSLELATVTPGLVAPQVAGFSQPHIRGVGSSTNGPGLEQPVATYIDGVYIASASASLMTLNNVERVEVLKGPQGTLFGRNATGGLIQVVTRDPKHVASGAFHLSYASYQTVTADAYLTGPLSDTLAADIAVRYEDQGKGYGHNVATSNEIGKLNHDLASRLKLLWEPGDDTQIRLAFDYASRSSSREAQRLDPKGYPGTFNNIVFGGPFPQGKKYDTSASFDQIFRLKSGGVSGQVNQGLGAVELQSITAYRKSSYSFPVDADGVPTSVIEIIPLRVKDRQFSQEFQLSPRDSGALKWVAGVYYFHAVNGYDPVNIEFGPTFISPVPGVPTTVTIDDDVRTNAIAAYAQATYELLPDTNLTLGGRYTYEHKEVSGTATFSIAGTPVATDPIITPASGIPLKTHFENFSYRIALDHKLGRDVLFYVSYNTGFKSGGYNLGSPDNPPYKPEKIAALEGGIKSELFDRHLRVNLSVFNYNYSNIQVGRYVGGNIFIYNGAKARNYGADIEAELAVGNGLNLTGGFSWLHARFKSFPNADFITPIPGLPDNLGGITPGSAAGNRLPFAPDTTFNIGGNYTLETSAGKFVLNGSYYRSGMFYAAPDNVHHQKAYDLIDLSVAWTDPGEHLTIKGFARNLGNTYYRTSMVESTAGPVISYGAPRTYGVTLGYKF